MGMTSLSQYHNQEKEHIILKYCQISSKWDKKILFGKKEQSKLQKKKKFKACTSLQVTLFRIVHGYWLTPKLLAIVVSGKKFEMIFLFVCRMVWASKGKKNQKQQKTTKTHSHHFIFKKLLCTSSWPKACEWSAHDSMCEIPAAWSEDWKGKWLQWLALRATLSVIQDGFHRHNLMMDKH